MERAPASSLNIHLIPTRNDDALFLVYQGTEELERIYRSIKTDKYLLNSYATDDMTAKEASTVELF